MDYIGEKIEFSWLPLQQTFYEIRVVLEMKHGWQTRQAEDTEQALTSCSLLISYLVYRINVV
jgi:hypothetical protein